MLLSELGQRIRSRRERLGLKQLDIANALQISPQAVSKWERGENSPDIAILGALSKLLGVSTDWLLDTYRDGLDEFDATVFTSTVLGAYAKSLRMRAGEFAVWANGFLFQLTEAVLRYDGIPIKYMGDAFLCFFSGVDHQQRATKAAGLAKRLITDELVIGLHSGEIYLGTMGHPDYAHRDITGEAVNFAFLIRNWAESHIRGGVAATTSVVEHLDAHGTIVHTTAVNFTGLDNPIDIHELYLR
jgi:transcriptional regulator with XRE-family HTH domain